MSEKYEPFSKRDGLQQRIADSERILSRSEQQQGVTNIPVIRERLLKDKRKLDSVTPPDVTGEQRDALIRRQEKLTEAIIHGQPDKGLPPMPSKQQMWGNGVGDANQDFQHSQYIKNHNLDENGNLKRIDPRAGEQGMREEWKDNRRILGKDHEEYATDLASIEHLRPDKAEKSDFMRYQTQNYSMPSLSTEQLAEATGGEVNPISKLADEMDSPPSPAEMLKTTHKIPIVCSHKTKAGKPCRGTPIGDTCACVAHKEK